MIILFGSAILSIILLSFCSIQKTIQKKYRFEKVIFFNRELIFILLINAFIEIFKQNPTLVYSIIISLSILEIISIYLFARRKYHKQTFFIYMNPDHFPSLKKTIQKFNKRNILAPIFGSKYSLTLFDFTDPQIKEIEQYGFLHNKKKAILLLILLYSFAIACIIPYFLSIK